MDKKPSVWSFALAFREHWFAAMSGGFSVPFAFATALVDNKYVQAILLALAFGGAWFAAYQIWKVEREKVIALQNAELSRDREKQSLLNDIAALRVQMVRLRIEMEEDAGPKKYSAAHWQQKFDALQNAIGIKIEQFASKAEADAYLHRGNIQRQPNPMVGGFVNPLHVDLCIHDLDYLRQFIHDYSRHKERQGL